MRLLLILLRSEDEMIRYDREFVQDDEMCWFATLTGLVAAVADMIDIGRKPDFCYE